MLYTNRYTAGSLLWSLACDLSGVSPKPEKEFTPIILPDDCTRDYPQLAKVTRRCYELGDIITVFIPLRFLGGAEGVSTVQSGEVLRRVLQPNGTFIYEVDPSTPGAFTKRWHEGWVLTSRRQARLAALAAA